MIEADFNSQDFEGIPLLLAFSGGPDSTVLFHLLLARGYPFQVAHVDHGWRSESASEAAAIGQICGKWEIKCHIRVLKLEGPNLEDRSRQARLAFFREICAAEELKGVMLGHHADDQAETVLKRVFEGASLPKLKGLSPKAQFGELTLYRPLLKTSKAEILQWLDSRDISYFRDPTNHDSRFLRSRMREELLPSLSEQFGKQVASSLCRLGESARELAEHLESSLAPFRQRIVNQDGDVSLDFSYFPAQSSFMYKAILRDLFEKESLTLSKTILDTIIFHLQTRRGPKTIQVGQRKVDIHKGNLTIRKLKLISL